MQFQICFAAFHLSHPTTLLLQTQRQFPAQRQRDIIPKGLTALATSQAHVTRGWRKVAQSFASEVNLFPTHLGVRRDECFFSKDIAVQVDHPKIN